MLIVCILTQYAGVFQENSCDGLTYFLDFFDKTKSQKRCEEMLREPSGGQFRPYSHVVYPVS